MGANVRTLDSGLVPGRQVLDAFLGQVKISHATLERVVDGLSTHVNGRSRLARILSECFYRILRLRKPSGQQSPPVDIAPTRKPSHMCSQSWGIN